MKKTGLVISHAHWDIEWYMPFRAYRFWLVDLLDGLQVIAKENPEFRSFVMDGQVAPLDHYLEVRPEAEQAIRDLVRQGKLAIGPFYTQFDEWLVSPESIVRNCLFGRRRAAELGGWMRAGYLPDNFGHPPQLAQILAGFGIDNLIFMRGMPDRPAGFGDEFLLEGLDGTRVLAIHLSDTYCNAVGIGSRPNLKGSVYQQGPFGDWMFGYTYYLELARVSDVTGGAQQLVGLARKAADRHPSGVVPLANGCDHTPPQARIGEVIAAANKMQEEVVLLQGTCEDLVRMVSASGTDLPVYTGALWGARYQLLLSGTLATRTYIKQNNFVSEALLERYADPLAAYAGLYGRAFPANLLEEAWKLLFTNHAHDGIHGSSTDAVHVEMMQRFLAVRQIALGICHGSLEYLGGLYAPADAAGGIPLAAYNPVRHGEWPSLMEVWVDSAADSVSVMDRRGNLLPTQLITDAPGDAPDSTQATSLPWPGAFTRHLVFAARVPGLGIETFSVVPGAAGKEQFLASDELIENEFFSVRYQDGSFEIKDKRTGRLFRGIGVVEEEADAGDAWDYSPPWEPSAKLTSTEFNPRCRCVQSGPVRSTLRIDVEMIVPARLDGQVRSSEVVRLPLSVQASLTRGIPRVDVSAELENTARDHRLRFRCPTGIDSNTVTSQGHFGILERPIEPPHTGEGWQQPPLRSFPFREWIAVEDRDHGLALACRGLYEYEAAVGSGGVELFVTLLRGIGTMGRHRMRNRAPAASPAVPIPDAQCLGVQRFGMALIPFDGPREERMRTLSALAAGYLFPPLVHVMERREGSPGGEAMTNTLPGLPPLITFRSPHLEVSGFKRADDGKGCILRLWENQGWTGDTTLELPPCFGRAWETNLAEETVREIPILNRAFALRVLPYRITTLRLETAAAGEEGH